VLLILAILALGGYLVWTKYFSSPKTTSTPTPIAIVTPTQDLTANWNTYANSIYGFEFKYPLDWQTYSSTDNSAGIINLTDSNKCYSIDFTVISDISETLSQYVISTYGAGGQQDNLKEKFVSSFGETAIIGPQGVGEIKSILYKNNTTIIQSTVIKNPDNTCLAAQYDQILSTFKFNAVTPLPTP
jgi:hypothetical protein